MKSKIVLLILSLLLAAVLAGCGSKESSEPAEEAQKAAEEEVLQDNTPKEDISQEAVPGEETVIETGDALRKRALDAYRDILKAAPAASGEHPELFDASFDYDQNTELLGKHYDLFALWDIDGNEIPELIALSTVNFRWTPVSVYTFADGEAVLLKDPSQPGAHGTFEQKSTANGAYVTYFCEENHIHSVWRGAGPQGEAEEENHAYALEGAVLTETACSASEGDAAIYFHDIAKTNTSDNLNAELCGADAAL